ncbi:MAG TPA: hypothetical protein VNY31_06655 [Solirubrobacteraceae bacterium]|nr:hypothetical protein [Solirubrobacteraceae bacterium]
MGHRDFTTTLIYADFAPDPAGGAAFAERAFGGLARQEKTASTAILGEASSCGVSEDRGKIGE